MVRSLLLIGLLATVPFRPTAPTLAPAPAIEQRLLDTFRPLIGMQEKPIGSNRGPLIDQFNRGAGVPLGSPWCASVADWGYKKNGLRGRGAYSPSWYSKERVVPRDRVRPGDMALVWFPSKGRWAHVIAIVEKVRERDVICWEGNTNAQGSREGHGFFRRIRSKDSVTFVRWHNQS